ncbi:MAG TPA: hypothetical protein VHY57_10740 [Rhizomicrobium sp.]|jgi:hypothetical protein|nr:hypothetical protein [Rhizomicrobium sp.]
MRQCSDQAPVGVHGYGPDTICLFLRLVLVAGVSLRGACRVLGTIRPALGLSLAVPHWTTGRLWLLRLGHAVLTASLQQAGDWAWVIDHSVQIGRDKCLVILGIRLAHLPEPGQSLRHQDMQLIALLPAGNWTSGDVDQALEEASQRSGVPRVIVDDHGADLCGGVALFQGRHPQTAEIYDAKHKAACLLKKRLDHDAGWREFQSQVGKTRCAVQQTELAFLAPPGAKLKARFMNLGPVLGWAMHVLAVLGQPSLVQQFATAGRLKEKFGWIEGFAAELAQWSQWQQVVDAAVTHANQQGVYRGSAGLLAKRFAQLGPLSDSARQLAAELLRFVRCQESQARPGERLPASSEVLESCFGKFKQLEKQQSRGGFTQLLLGFGALLADITTATVRQAMQASGTADVWAWAAKTLGVTLYAQRKLAYGGATKSG